MSKRRMGLPSISELEARDYTKRFNKLISSFKLKTHVLPRASMSLKSSSTRFLINKNRIEHYLMMCFAKNSKPNCKTTFNSKTNFPSGLDFTLAFMYSGKTKLFVDD